MALLEEVGPVCVCMGIGMCVYVLYVCVHGCESLKCPFTELAFALHESGFTSRLNKLSERL